MAYTTTEGVTLLSFPLKENSKIVKVYTNTRGLLSFVVNNATKKNSEMLAFCSPCTYSEIIYIDKQKELLNVREATIKNHHLQLRDSYEKIDAAIKIAKSTLASQLQDKPNQVLFNMLSKYLRKLSYTNNPYPYLCSFQLKLLLLEGVLHLSDRCSICNNLAACIVKGDYFCESHARYQGIPFTVDEIKELSFLAKIKRFSEIDTFKVSDNLREKIQNLFLHIFD